MTTVLDGVPWVEQIREIDFTLDAQGGETITPIVATPNARILVLALQHFDQQIKAARARLDALERF